MDWEIKVSDHHKHVIRSERGGTRIAEADANLSEDEATLIISRLVECWNACAGMADPAAEIADLRAKLDKAVGALENLGGAHSPSRPQDMEPKLETVARYARETLARIKGE